MQIVLNRPLVIANCQFKNLRENTLLLDMERLTHARTIQVNSHGGSNIIKNLHFEQFRFRNSLGKLAPSRGNENDSNRFERKRKRKIQGVRIQNCDLEKTIQVVNGKIVPQDENKILNK